MQFPSPVLAALRMPEDFAAAGEYTRREDIRTKVRVSADPERHLEWLLGDVEMGFEEINLHSIPRSTQEGFIEVFGERVLPELAKAG